MKEIAKIMMALLRSAVCGEQIAEVVNRNMTAERLEKLYALSAHHDMAHLVAAALEAAGCLGEDEVSERFRRQQSLAVYRAVGQEYELERVGQALGAAGIDYIPLKGAVIRTLYPESWMRTGCDVDILVKPEEHDRAEALLRETLGYRRKGRTAHDVSLYSESGVHVELHYDMLEEIYAANSSSVLAEVWSYAEPCEGMPHRSRLSDDMFYFYHIAHMAKHFSGGGCGVRPFLDLWLMNHRTAYDRAARMRLIEAGGLLAFAQGSERLSEAWFSGEEWDALSEDMSRYILRAGVYGVMETFVAAGQVKKGSRRKNMLSRIWLPYDILKRHYPSLDGRRWLILFYQMRRWTHLFRRGKMKQSIEELKAGASISEEESRETASLLSRLEL